MKKFLIFLLLFPVIASAQITKSQVTTRIDQRISTQIRPIDIRNTLKFMADYTRQADSTANTKIGQAAIIAERTATAVYTGKTFNFANNNASNIPIAAVSTLTNELNNIKTDITTANVSITTLNGTVGTLTTTVNGKQATLVSAVNIKTVKGLSMLGPGNIPIIEGNPRSLAYYTQTQIRAGLHDTASVVSVINPLNQLVFLYKYDAADLASLDDSAFVIRHVNKRYKLVSTTFTPKEAGAVGDGVTNDTQPMRKWIAKGGSLEMDPNAVYYIKGTLTSRKQIVTIDGRNARIKVDSSVNVSSTNGIIRIGKAQNVELRNFQLDHVRYLAQSTWHTKSISGIRIDSSERVVVENVIINKNPHYALHINRSPDVTVRNVKVNGYYRGAIQVEYGSSNVMIDDVKIYGTGDSLGVNTTGASIPNTMGEDLTGMGIQVLQSESVTIRNAKINDALDNGIRVETSRSITIDGCNIMGSGADAIRINGRGTGNNSRRWLPSVRIVNNNLQNNIYRHPGGTALLLIQDTQGGLIANNTFGDTTKTGGTLNGVRLTNFLGWNNNVTIRSNIFNEIRLNSECINIFGGSANTQNVTVEDNFLNGKMIIKSMYGKTVVKHNKVFYSKGGNALDMDQNADCEIIGNTIVAPTGAAVRNNVSDAYPTKFVVSDNNMEVGLRAVFTVTTGLDTLYERNIEVANNRIFSSKWLARQSLLPRTVRDTVVYVNRAIDITTFSEAKLNRNYIRGFEDGIVLAGSMRVGYRDPMMEINGNDLASMRYRGILVLTSGSTPKTIKNLDIIENKFFDCARDSSSSPLVVAVNNLVTYSTMRVTGNEFTQNNTRPAFALTGTTGLKIPLLILRDNILDATTVADPANLITYVTNLRGYTNINSSYNPPSIAAGAIHSTTVTYPHELTQGRVILSIRSGHSLAGEILFTGQITADNEVTIYYRNLSASPIDLPAGALAVRID